MAPVPVLAPHPISVTGLVLSLGARNSNFSGKGSGLQSTDKVESVYHQASCIDQRAGTLSVALLLLFGSYPKISAFVYEGISFPSLHKKRKF